MEVLVKHDNMLLLYARRPKRNVNKTRLFLHYESNV